MPYVTVNVFECPKGHKITRNPIMGTEPIESCDQCFVGEREDRKEHNEMRFVCERRVRQSATDF
jgi:hypothetical protein